MMAVPRQLPETELPSQVGRRGRAERERVRLLATSGGQDTQNRDRSCDPLGKHKCTHTLTIIWRVCFGAGEWTIRDRETLGRRQEAAKGTTTPRNEVLTAHVVIVPLPAFRRLASAFFNHLLCHLTNPQ